MKIIFAGTPPFAATILQSLIDSQHEICAVFTQADKPAGRGRKLTASEVKILAQQNNLPIYQPNSLKEQQVQQILQQLDADLMVVVAYGLLLPKAVLTIPKYGCINIHASLLPRWRGAAPIQRAILAGDQQTGISIMQMDEGLDTGAVWLEKTCAISTTDTSQSLHDSLAQLGAQALVETLKGITNNSLELTPQNNELACYAEKVTKAEAKIDWQKSAHEIDRLIRAFNPWPIAFTEYNHETIRIHQATVKKLQQHPPGTIIEVSNDKITIACGENALIIEKLQKSGGKILTTQQFINGQANFFTVGQLFT